jgi:hypothetical protein
MSWTNYNNTFSFALKPPSLSKKITDFAHTHAIHSNATTSHYFNNFFIPATPPTLLV